MRARVGTLLLATAFTALSAMGARLSFVFESNGAPVQGAEVCFFPAFDEPGDHDFVHNYFRSNDVRCLPAGDPIEVPVGRFNFFGRRGTSLIGSVSRMAVTDTDDEERDAKEIYSDLEAAVPLLISGMRGDLYAGAVVYAPTSVQFVPQVPGENHVLVPSDVESVPLILYRGVPIAVGEPVKPVAGELVRFKQLESPTLMVRIGRSPDVITVKTHPGYDDVWSIFHSLHPPTFSLKYSSGSSVPPLVDVSTAAQADEGILFFTVPFREDNPQLAVEGDMWEERLVKVAVSQERITSSPVKIDLVPAGVLVIDWTTSTECHEVSDVSVELRACDGCAPQSSAQVDGGACAGELRFVSVPVGLYTAYARNGSDEIEMSAAVLPGQETHLILRFE